jgi:trans-2,3-dihydro-3-hydroxyanthranilic acid synthase
MPIPAIQPYPMPTEDDVPAGPLSFRPDPSRAVLLVHDLQRYFVERFPAGRSPVVELLRNVGRIRQAASALDIPVVYTAQPAMGRAERGLLFDLWGAGIGTDPHRGAIVPEAGRSPRDVVSPKTRYSAFHGSRLARTIASYGRDQLIVCGVFAHIGCLLTACDAYAHDLETFFVADAVADFDARRHLMAIDYAARLCAVTLTTRQLLARLSGHG